MDQRSNVGDGVQCVFLSTKVGDIHIGRLNVGRRPSLPYASHAVGQSSEGRGVGKGKW